MRILHCFADRGVEADTLSNFGDVVRVGIDAKASDTSDAIKADAKELPFRDDVTFDLGVFHPPCTKWSSMPSADRDNAENLIPLARDIAYCYCDHWIIENKPGAPLDDPVLLDGHMFGLPIEYERGFETSFHVDQPPKQSKLAETSPFFYSNRSREWWAAVKGCRCEYPKQHIAKNTIPAAYLNYLMQHYAKADDTVNREGYVDREKYEDYDREMDTRRAKERNESLEAWVTHE